MDLVDQFHKLWHEDPNTWKTCKWRGFKSLKCPMDLWIYQELLHRIQPALVIETGTCHGGTALYLADMLELICKGKIVTVDIKPPKRPPSHRRLTYLLGSSINPTVAAKLKQEAKRAKGPVLVILDSNHKASHVLQEMLLYAPLVSVGSYLIVEDTDINTLVRFDHGPGPAQAVNDFLQRTDNFVVDETCERLKLTLNRGGYLRRVK